MNAHKAASDYRKLVGKKKRILFVSLIILFLSFVLDIMVGPSKLGFADVIKAIFYLGDVSKLNHVIVWVLRLPYAVVAVVVGCALGIAGAEMQTILDNPLASPYTLGLSAASGFGAALAIVLGVSVIPCADVFIIPLNAFIISSLSAFLIYMVSVRKGATTSTIVLMGIAMLFIFQAFTSLLQFVASEQELQAVVFWLFGDLLKATWDKIAIIAAVLFVCVLLLYRDMWKLTAMRLGDTKARSLGINVERQRLKVMMICSVITSVAVCFVGTIGFIGLAAPHIARMAVGEDQRFFLPLSALCGSILLTAASVISKMITPGVMFPIGVVTAFIGVPFFISMILRTKGDYW